MSLAAGSAWAQDDRSVRTDAREGGSSRPGVSSEMRALIERADRAWDAMDSVVFEFEANPKGMEQVVTQMPRAKGEIWFAPNAEGTGLVRAAGTGSVGEEGESAAFDIVWDASRATWLDHENKRVMRGARPTGYSGQMAMTVMLPPAEGLRGKSPFAALAAEAERVMSGPAVEVDGERCEVMVFMIGQAGYRFAIAQDGLPRQVTVQFPIVSQELVLRRPDTSRNLSEAAFEIRAPEGYETAMAPDQRPQMQPNRGGTTTQRRRIEPGGAQPVVERPAETPRATDASRPTATPAPEFELETPEGETVRLSDLRGRVVVLDFWGTWCLPCKLSSPLVQKLHEDYEGKPVTVLGLAVRERDLSKPAEYMDENGYTYTILLEADDVATEYRVRAYPSFVVIGPEGELLHMARGFHPENNDPFPKIRELIDEHLAKLGE
ncbi:MAG: TlpA family protein disulfide reductase [Phycisphaerales bacterium]|nr:MAG: TlpA family protein disulfide reductase [Phycisphaerales bacterium]